MKRWRSERESVTRSCRCSSNEDVGLRRLRRRTLRGCCFYHMPPFCVSATRCFYGFVYLARTTEVICLHILWTSRPRRDTFVAWNFSLLFLFVVFPDVLDKTTMFAHNNSRLLPFAACSFVKSQPLVKAFASDHIKAEISTQPHVSQTAASAFIRQHHNYDHIYQLVPHPHARHLHPPHHTLRLTPTHLHHLPRPTHNHHNRSIPMCPQTRRKAGACRNNHPMRPRLRPQLPHAVDARCEHVSDMPGRVLRDAEDCCGRGAAVFCDGGVCG